MNTLVTESIATVVGRVTSNSRCPHWCQDQRAGPHWHDFTKALEVAGYRVDVTIPHALPVIPSSR